VENYTRCSVYVTICLGVTSPLPSSPQPDRLTRERSIRSYSRLLRVRCRPFHPHALRTGISYETPKHETRLCCRHSPYGGQLLPATLLCGAPKFLPSALHRPAMTPFSTSFGIKIFVSVFLLKFGAASTLRS
jgi:hypothetical protein